MGSEKRTTIDTEVLIVGAGFSGLGMGIGLTREGQRDFIIVEKADEVGGTWRDNTYPGCACDIQSHMYSFSFEPNPGWTRLFSTQPEIWDYLRRTANKHNLRRHIHFGLEVTGARWDAGAARWLVRVHTGVEYRARYLVAGVGALHIPNIPALPGIERFEGETFHSARWNHEYPLAGKRVAVIGTGASAIQFVPEIAGRVAGLTLFQRSAPWVLPRPDHAVPLPVRLAFRLFPPLRRLYRAALYWLNESAVLGFNGHPRLLEVLERLGTRHLRNQVADPVLREKLTPRYRIGCKRLLGSNTYYPALARPNAEVVTAGIAEVREREIVDTDGVAHPVDAIIYGTGFHVTDAFEYLDIKGRDGADLARRWREEGIQTHLGITVAGFPNLFFLLGPNTGLGHNSVVFMIESQIRYALDAMAMAAEHGAETLEVRRTAQAAFNARIQRRLAKGVWSTGGCTNWYLDAKGVNRTIWPGFTWRYWLATRRVKPRDFELTVRREPSVDEPGAPSAPRSLTALPMEGR
ncbi:NAD(P)/FAD-dependent oxidoreductase [Pseudonocardia eucalypti]|uniref:NAD(P)/FAD-dependent oxidoreductase n=1 Tax=Pseudonocardia eucalypti TaxID=648755 RepID=A0ABP9QDZ0_9PSEU|nr:cation diffusion facilitator CzcD-associated flavoprotein CzcO [Pseudonocardia eucalypti]